MISYENETLQRLAALQRYGSNIQSPLNIYLSNKNDLIRKYSTQFDLTNGNNALGFYHAVKKDLASHEKGIYEEVQETLLALAALEAAYESKTLNKYTKKSISIDKLNSEDIEPILKNKFYVDGKTPKTLIDEFIFKSDSDLKQQLLLSQVNEEDAKGTVERSLQYSALKQKQAKAIGITLANAVAGAIRFNTLLINKELFKGWRYVVTFDGRTSSICQKIGTDNKLYDMSETPLHPFHYNCRTTHVAELKDEFNLSSENNTRPAKGDNITRININKTYDAWLREQSVKFQKELLGPTKYKLFKSGIKLNKFVTDDLKSLNISELKVIYQDILDDAA